MSILRRLILSITIVICVILLGVLALNITATHRLLSEQMFTQSNDAAVSLALALSQPGADDPVMQELLISAIFDGGHFSRIALMSPTRQPLIVRQIENPPNYVAPVWFRAITPISAKSVTHSISIGWEQIGEITVEASDVYAWNVLWDSSLRMTLLIVSVGLAWAVFALALMRWIERRLLASIGGHVQEMGQGNLEECPIQPKVREFANVTQALNQARQRLRITAAEQNAKVQTLELPLNRDETTGIANRRYFLNELQRVLKQAEKADGSQAVSGHVILLHLRDLSELNHTMGRKPIDHWLTSICQRLNALLETGHPSLFARLNGSEFIILLPDSELTAATALAKRMDAELVQSRIPTSDGAQGLWLIALSDYDHTDDIRTILTRLDEGLRQVENARLNNIAICMLRDQ